MLQEQILGFAVGRINEALHFLVNQLSRSLTVGARGEGIAFLLAVFHHAHLLAHAPRTDHAVSNGSGLTDVAHGAVGDVTELDLFSHAATHGHHEVIEQLVFAVIELVAFGKPHGGAKRRTTGNDGHLVEWISMLEHLNEDRVTGFMIGGVELFLVGKRQAAALAAPADLVTGLFEFGSADALQVAAGGEESGFVDDVGQFCTREPWSAARDFGEVGIVVELHLLGMNAEDLFAALHIRQTDGDLTVKATGTEQRRIQHVRTVRGRDDDDTFLRVKAIHLHKHRIERLFALVMTTAHAVTAMATDGIDFINEDQARSVFLALLEHVTDAAGAHANEHFHEIRSADTEEWHVSLASNGLGQERFSGPRRADHEHALGDFAAEALEFLGILEKLDDLPDFFLGLITTGHVLEGDLVAVLIQKLRTAFAEAESPAASHLHLLTDEEEDAHNEECREHEHEEHVAGITVVTGCEDELCAARIGFVVGRLEQFGDLFALVADVDLRLELCQLARGRLAFGGSGSIGHEVAFDELCALRGLLDEAQRVLVVADHPAVRDHLLKLSVVLLNGASHEGLVAIQKERPSDDER